MSPQGGNTDAIGVNLYHVWDENYSDPMLLVSNQARHLLLLCVSG
ncbi:MAG: hypothetical protein ACE5PV_16285 [Candidatus Poribacteria bacterium]